MCNVKLCCCDHCRVRLLLGGLTKRVSWFASETHGLACKLRADTHTHIDGGAPRCLMQIRSA